MSFLPYSIETGFSLKMELCWNAASFLILLSVSPPSGAGLHDRTGHARTFTLFLQIQTHKCMIVQQAFLLTKPSLQPL